MKLDIDNRKHWLNEYGERYWVNKEDPNMTAHRSYYWVDSLVFIDESKGRLYTGQMRFSSFMETQSHLWIIMDKNYFRREKLKQLLK